MTTATWNDDRLNSLADAVEANRRQTEINSMNIADLVTATGSLLRAAEAHQQEIQILTQDSQELRLEMRGLQLEVRRLVEELRQRREGGNG